MDKSALDICDKDKVNNYFSTKNSHVKPEMQSICSKNQVLLLKFFFLQNLEEESSTLLSIILSL